MSSFWPVAAAIKMEETGLDIIGSELRAIDAGLTGLGNFIQERLDPSAQFDALLYRITTAGACAGSSMRCTPAEGRTRYHQCQST
jgi:hypothetical protein